MQEESLTTRISRSPQSEESRTQQIYFVSVWVPHGRARDTVQLVDEKSYRGYPDRFRTIGGLKEYYGSAVEDKLKELTAVLTLMDKLFAIFSKVYGSCDALV